MGNTLFLSISSHGIPQKIKKLLTFALLKEAKRIQQVQTVFINAEPDSKLNTAPTKLAKDHPLYRFSGSLNGMDTPVLDREDFLELCDEMGRRKNPNVFEHTITLVSQPKPPSNPSVSAFDSICVITPPDSSVIPVLYQTITAIRSSSRIVPILLWVFGESKIETGAEFFLSVKNELEQLAKDDIELAYLGCIKIPPEEFNILTRFDLDLHTTYPDSPIVGAVRYASERMFTFPEVASRALDPQTLRSIVQNPGQK